MTIETYIKQRERRLLFAERKMLLRVKRALVKTVEPIYSVTEIDPYTAEKLIDSVVTKQYIEEALKWAYVDFGYQYVQWFLGANAIQQKKSDDWLRALENLFIKKGAENVTAIFNTTKLLAKKAIQDAIAAAGQGASIQSINKAIRDNIKGKGGAISTARAQMIARTEVISASNIATHEATVNMGLDLEHKWLTGGLNVRDTHKQAEGQGWIPLDQKFRVGDAMMAHPGDPDGGANEVINCKCVEIFRGV